MKEFVRENIQFVLICFLWLFVGIYIRPVSMVLIPCTVILWYNKGFHKEILLGFFYILSLSDNHWLSVGFAGQVKTIYVVISIIL